MKNSCKRATFLIIIIIEGLKRELAIGLEDIQKAFGFFFIRG